MTKIVVEMEPNYSEEEMLARKFFFNLWRNMDEPCDKEVPTDEPDLPAWFDPEKYQKGREFFFRNKWSILESNMVGLICLLADIRGLSILSMTGKSSTAEDAYKRYSSTVMHVLSWYYVDLTPKSKSKISLKQVRRAHYNASTKAVEHKLGAITQPMMSLTAFGFMGLPLIYPNTMGLVNDTPENIEGFVHFWAVVCYILGIKDEFNLCLLPVETVRIICKFFLRFVLIPQMQIETPNFKHMVAVLLEGIKKIVPLRDPTIYLSLTKIYCQIPGYNTCISSYDTPNHRMIFSQSELDAVYEVMNPSQPHFPPTTKIPIIKIHDIPQISENNNDMKTGPDYEHVKEVLRIDNVNKIEIQYKTFDSVEPISLGSELFDSEKFIDRFTIKAMFFTKKLYHWSAVCRWLMDYVFEKDMQKRFGEKYIGEYNKE